VLPALWRARLWIFDFLSAGAAPTLASATSHPRAAGRRRPRLRTRLGCAHHRETELRQDPRPKKAHRPLRIGT
jgi:hypothetical protein